VGKDTSALLRWTPPTEIATTQNRTDPEGVEDERREEVCPYRAPDVVGSRTGGGAAYAASPPAMIDQAFGLKRHHAGCGAHRLERPTDVCKPPAFQSSGKGAHPPAMNSRTASCFARVRVWRDKTKPSRMNDLRVLNDGLSYTRIENEPGSAKHRSTVRKPWRIVPYVGTKLRAERRKHHSVAAAAACPSVSAPNPAAYAAGYDLAPLRG